MMVEKSKNNENLYKVNKKTITGMQVAFDTKPRQPNLNFGMLLELEPDPEFIKRCIVDGESFLVNRDWIHKVFGVGVFKLSVDSSSYDISVIPIPVDEGADPIVMRRVLLRVACTIIDTNYMSVQ